MRTPRGPTSPPEDPAGPSDDLLSPSIFGPATIAPAQAAVPIAANPAPILKLVVKGLNAGERNLLEGLVKISQRRTPRLEILDDAQVALADVVMIDTQDHAALLWAGRHPWLAGRAVIWIDGTDPARGHTAVRRPVQWPILPMLLARALESAPRTELPARVRPKDHHLGAFHPDNAPQILVVDDNLGVRMYLRSVLEPRGYAVTDADCVVVALHSLGQRAFDCVLMDVVMPGVDGFEGCQQIKARLRGAAAVPVIMLTAKTSSFDRIRGKMAGCDAYLTKPVDPQHLIEVLAQHVHAKPTRVA